MTMIAFRPIRIAVALAALAVSTLFGVGPLDAQIAPFVPPISCDDLFNSEDGILFGSNDINTVSPCTFPDRCPDCFGFNSGDPNDKVGSPGAASYLSGAKPLPYAVYFENVATATAAAQQVVITDRLDTLKLNLGTLSLGPIAFGDTTIVPPPGLSTFTQDVDLRPKVDLIVRVTANLDGSSGVLTWRFTSLDPATGQPTTDPLAGFLPPNTSPPAGQGSVVFTVDPAPGLPTGTPICNQATIVFDVNAPIETPQWCNTNDNTKPASLVSPLAATQSSPSFLVQWTGSDVGSGIRDYTIVVSDNGGPVTLFRTNTADTAAMFTGQPGHSYAFSSIARDRAGNVEDAHAGPDTTTRVATVGCDNAITLHLDSGGGLSETAPPSGIAAFAGSPALSRSGGNPWTLIGKWAGTVDPPSCDIRFDDLHLWLGLKNSDDQGTNLDVRVSVLLNGVQVGSRDFTCIKGLTRNPALATEISYLPFFAGGPKISGDNDVAVQVSARIGTGDSCGGHNNATGLRLYYDSATRDSRFRAIINGGT